MGPPLKRRHGQSEGLTNGHIIDKQDSKGTAARPRPHSRPLRRTTSCCLSPG
jgi:hypothetical protein